MKTSFVGGGSIVAAFMIFGPAHASGVAAPASVTLARALPAGALLSEADILVADATNADAAALALRLVGKELRRMLPEGAALRDADLRAPLLVERNKPVRMEFRRGLLSVTTEGRALSGGAAGDIVKVINSRSKTVVTAIVAGPGKVVIE